MKLFLTPKATQISISAQSFEIVELDNKDENDIIVYCSNPICYSLFIG